MNPVAFNRHLGELIRFERKRRKMTQQQLAWELGISREAVANMELGRQGMPASRLIQIMKFFGFTSVTLTTLIPKERDSDEDRQ